MEHWHRSHGRTWRYCDCADWEAAADGPTIEPGTRHFREKVPGTKSVEVCFLPDHERKVVTVLRIRGHD